MGSDTFCQPDVAESNRLRNLGTYERFRVALHDLGFHFNVSTAAKYSFLNHEAGLVQQRFVQALRKTIGRHPALRVSVRGKSSNSPYFVHLPEIDLHKIVRFEAPPIEELNSSLSHVHYLEQLLTAENSTGFDDENLPLWRMVILELNPKDRTEETRSFLAFFVYHHVIADGMSGMAFHKTVLEELNELEKTTKSSTQESKIGESDMGESRSWMVNSCGSEPLLPSMDDVLSYPSTLSAKLQKGFLGSIMSRLFPSTPKNTWTGKRFNSDEPIRTQIRLIHVLQQDTAVIVARCKEKQTSVTAYLQNVVACAFFDVLPDVDALRCATAISLRRFLPKTAAIGDDDIGLWIDGFTQDMVRNRCLNNNRLCWNQTRICQARINHEVGKGEYDLGFASLKGVQDFRSSFLLKIGHDRENSYSITNIGMFDLHGRSHGHNLDGSNETAWKIEEVLFSQSAHVIGSVIQFCVASNAAGGMWISLNWQNGVVSNDQVDEVVKQLKQRLLSID